MREFLLNVVVRVSHGGQEALLGTPLNPGWCHLAFRYDLAAKKQQILHNGMLMAESAMWDRRSALRAPVQLTIGRRQQMAVGYLRELRIWKTARSDADIAKHIDDCIDLFPPERAQQLTSTEGGLLAAWSFCGNMTSIVAKTGYEKPETRNQNEMAWRYIVSCLFSCLSASSPAFSL
jgi:hypothetical protein